MDAIHRLLAPVVFPRMVRIQQIFDDACLRDIPAAVRDALAACPAYARITPGMRLALTVGSRGIASLPVIVRAIVDALKDKGAEPFIVPAMGSHGGATDEGQKAVLLHLGVTEESVGCPIHSSLEVVQVGTLSDGFPVYMDKFAYESDGVVVFNRIKPHTGFRARHESGLLKMLAIGLGKHKGAESSHMMGFGNMPRIIEEASAVHINGGKLALGVGTIESAYDEVAEIIACGPEDFFQADEDGLKKAFKNMPKLCVDKLDLLIVDEVGKEYSGGGMDSNITGRYVTPYISGGPDIDRIVALDMTEGSHGNASGIGLVDVVTASLIKKIDMAATYTNNITSKVPASSRLPMHFETEEMVIRCGLKTCRSVDYAKARVMRIPNTLHMREAFISEVLLPEVENRPDVRILGTPQPMRFNANGTLADPY
ncbi:MAG: lactate racemase domain-containing protein [Desulfovibrio sp.]|jgi:hypothetical protein|nr:lactate racemase domain-containing protein [Desulfovibrio sp.]